MILANVRESLTRDDAQLAVHLLARSGRAGDPDAVLREEGLDAILDDPRLLGALVQQPLGARASLRLFCYVVVRHALRNLGEDDRSLADYVAAILVHFGIRDRASRVGTSDDEQYNTLAALLDEVDQADARRAFLVRAHLGNYALWVSGIFPDFIEHRKWRRGGPPLDYYEEMGRKGFRLAADHRLAQHYGLAPLYVLAADRFDRLRVALNQISDTLLFPGVSSPDRLMRQVRDEARWRLLS
jgi:hypothetical protein